MVWRPSPSFAGKKGSVAGIPSGSKTRAAIGSHLNDVRPLSDEERAQMAGVIFPRAEYLHEAGSTSLLGDPGFITYERAWSRPTLEINDLCSGFQGGGLKTVLPSLAHAKISCRLAADQESSQIVDFLVHHVRKVAPGSDSFDRQVSKRSPSLPYSPGSPRSSSRRVGPKGFLWQGALPDSHGRDSPAQTQCVAPGRTAGGAGRVGN